VREKIVQDAKASTHPAAIHPLWLAATEYLF
jgi:hypothetical protein